MYKKFRTLNFAETSLQFQYFVQTIQNQWTLVVISKLSTFSAFQFIGNIELKSKLWKFSLDQVQYKTLNSGKIELSL